MTAPMINVGTMDSRFFVPMTGMVILCNYCHEIRKIASVWGYPNPKEMDWLICLTCRNVIGELVKEPTHD